MSLPTILEEIIANKRTEVEERRRIRPIEIVRALAEECDSPRDFYQALTRHRGPHVIAECKRQSPSKGILIENYDPASIAQTYERGGASAVSVLTDERFFGGVLADLTKVRAAVDMPVLRKDFIIDEYQIYEARAHGADTFLLIAGVLDTAQLQYFTEIGRDLGMEPLVECHNRADIDLAVGTDCKIIGINNRNLNNMEVSLETSVTQAKYLRKSAKDRVLVCESGIRSRQDIEHMRTAGYCAFLVGEYLMTAASPQQALVDLVTPAW